MLSSQAIITFLAHSPTVQTPASVSSFMGFRGVNGIAGVAWIGLDISTIDWVGSTGLGRI